MADLALRYELLAAKVKPRDTQRWTALGNTLDLLGRYGDAAGAYSVAANLGNRFQRVAALNDLAIANYYLGNLAAEASAYKSAVAIDAADATSADGLGWTELAAGHFAAAVAAFSRAVTLAPGIAELSADYAHALGVVRRPTTAEAVSRAALRHDPKNPSVLLALARALDQQGNSAATTVYAAGYALRPNAAGSAGNAMLAGTLAFYNGHLGEAYTDVRRATTMQPAVYPHWQMLGLVLTSMKQYREALAAALHAVALDPADSVSHGMLARNYLALGDYYHAEVR
jgi:tetratricopeptide (TPR) repeat protein